MLRQKGPFHRFIWGDLYVEPMFVKALRLMPVKMEKRPMSIVGVRFRSSTNECATRSGEKLKPRNLFDRTMMLLISSKKDMFE